MEVENLVPGDIVEISEGNIIPADMRVLESHDMKVDKSILFGTEEIQEVSVNLTKSSGKPLIEHNNILFFGCICKEGSGKGVVI